eukprot:TRINITY_DN6789_c0_g1_i16.p1 TRINITY_DN6789_c0_g1~~TRINITY_DN6789_c0_g1_i16.p1  ORF type:complete len:261 (-),score=-28.68 TRINITY_DN6789_c0_g1_i16:36-770(-)
MTNLKLRNLKLLTFILQNNTFNNLILKQNKKQPLLFFFCKTQAKQTKCLEINVHKILSQIQHFTNKQFSHVQFFIHIANILQYHQSTKMKTFSIKCSSKCNLNYVVPKQVLFHMLSIYSQFPGQNYQYSPLQTDQIKQKQNKEQSIQLKKKRARVQTQVVHVMYVQNARVHVRPVISFFPTVKFFFVGIRNRQKSKVVVLSSIPVQQKCTRAGVATYLIIKQLLRKHHEQNQLQYQGQLNWGNY